jgi:AAA+ ATPase superfamily predicted ATPase
LIKFKVRNLISQPLRQWKLPDFVNREKEKKELRMILNGKPNFVYFVYGPVDSEKTALLMEVWFDVEYGK